jgi:hypothetical protein
MWQGDVELELGARHHEGLDKIKFANNGNKMLQQDGSVCFYKACTDLGVLSFA